jgi:hypothetical protein
VVFTSGIIDISPPGNPGPGSCQVNTWPGLVAVGWGHTVGVLRNQTRNHPWADRGWGVGGVWLLGSRPVPASPRALWWVGVVWGVGVGLLFEIWIVDASINIFVVVSSVHHQPGAPAAVVPVLC